MRDRVGERWGVGERVREKKEEGEDPWVSVIIGGPNKVHERKDFTGALQCH